ncbi:MAG TPA: NHL repeat-containing protein [Candidatus Kapabacteria bacterium]|nr:NHL repeat-containing protein [Candidatus Kapabacteria bacterium]
MQAFLVFLMTFGHFLGAADMDRDVQGNIYVVDRTANAVVEFSPAGDSIHAVSGFGNGDLQFDEPVAVCASRGNDVYVADLNNHRIQRFNRTLDYVSTIYTREDPDERKRIGYPRDVVVTRQGDLLVIDGENHRVAKVNVLGQVERSFGDIKAGWGTLVDPQRIEVDESDNIYVLDRGRVVKFDPFGSFVAQFPMSANGPLAIAAAQDTMTVTYQHEHDIALIGLPEFAPVITYSVEGAPVTALFMGDRIVALEAGRVAVYTIPKEMRPR